MSNTKIIIEWSRCGRSRDRLWRACSLEFIQSVKKYTYVCMYMSINQFNTTILHGLTTMHFSRVHARVLCSCCSRSCGLKSLRGVSRSHAQTRADLSSFSWSFNHLLSPLLPPFSCAAHGGNVIIYVCMCIGSKSICQEIIT